MDWSDILIRVVKTFVQWFCGAVVVTLPSSDVRDKAMIKSVTIGAVAAGVCAVMNVIMELMK